MHADDRAGAVRPPAFKHLVAAPGGAHEHHASCRGGFVHPNRHESSESALSILICSARSTRLPPAQHSPPGIAHIQFYPQREPLIFQLDVADITSAEDPESGRCTAPVSTAGAAMQRTGAGKPEKLSLSSMIITCVRVVQSTALMQVPGSRGQRPRAKAPMPPPPVTPG